MTQAFDPLSNLMANSETIQLKVIAPVQIKKGADCLSIRNICKLIRISDFDFPLVDYNFKSNTWIIVPGTDAKSGKDNFIIWKNCNHTVSTCIRFFRQLGWEITFTRWAKY